MRNVANLVPPYTPTGLIHGVSAALEFAVQILGVSTIMVMGHSHCGGVRAFVEHRGRTVPGDFIDSWMALMAPAANAVGDADGATGPAYLSVLEQASVVTTLGISTFPEIRSRVDDGRLHLLGAYFDVGSGDLSFYDPGTRAFTLVGHVAE